MAVAKFCNTLSPRVGSSARLRPPGRHAPDHLHRRQRQMHAGRGTTLRGHSRRRRGGRRCPSMVKRSARVCSRSRPARTWCSRRRSTTMNWAWKPWWSRPEPARPWMWKTTYPTAGFGPRTRAACRARRDSDPTRGVQVWRNPSAQTCCRKETASERRSPSAVMAAPKRTCASAPRSPSRLRKWGKKTASPQ